MMTKKSELPIRILVAEDDAVVGRDVREVLKEMGYRIVDLAMSRTPRADRIGESRKPTAPA